MHRDGNRLPQLLSWLPKQGPRFDGRTASTTLVKGLTLLFAAGVDRADYYYTGSLFGGSGYPSRT